MQDAAVQLRGVGHEGLTDGWPLTEETFCKTYADRIYKFAQLISRDSVNAEDLAHDALERALRGLRTFDPAKGEIEAWLWRIVVNAGRAAGRIERRQRLVFNRLVDMWPMNEKVIDLAEKIRADEVLQAVRALPARRRAVIALRYGADLDYRHVGMASPKQPP